MGCTTLGFLPTVGSQILALFFLGKTVTKIGASKKSKIEDEFSQQRNSYQVLANGGISWVLVILYLMNVFDGDFVVVSSLFAISSSTGDTFSSELGILSNETPRMITSLKKVPRGTNGGVTLFGFLAAGLGGFFIGVVTCFGNFSKFEKIEIIFLGVLAGLTGSIIDSLLGALLEFSGVDNTSGKVVSKNGKNIKIIQKRAVLSGNSVNLISSLATVLTLNTIF